MRAVYGRKYKHMNLYVNVATPLFIEFISFLHYLLYLYFSIYIPPFPQAFIV